MKRRVGLNQLFLIAVIFLSFQSTALAYNTFLCTGGIFKRVIGDNEAGECVEYVRYETGIGIHGDAKTWYSQAQTYNYSTGQSPKIGSIMVINEWGDNSHGHVGMVIDTRNNDQEVKLRHSNFKAYHTVSEDWINVSQYPVLGYIYCDGSGSDSGLEQISKNYRTVGQISWYPPNKTCVNASEWVRIVDGRAIQSFGSNSACYSVGLEYLNNSAYYDVLFGTSDLPQECSQ